MDLIIDASTLVAEAPRQRGRALLARQRLSLFIAAEQWSETEHELDRRTAIIIARNDLDRGQAEALRADIRRIVTQQVRVAPAEAYADRLAEAYRRVPRDSQDAPTVALALTLGCAIWTLDRDFFGCGLPTWTTETLLLDLDALDQLLTDAQPAL